MKQKPRKIALVGNPNCGKTTVFNLLTGSAQYVGNRAGVTVEEKEAFLKGNKNVIITDLPGAYSLSPYTSEEIVTRNYIINEKPDAILVVADASGLQRSIYLVLQLRDMGIPLVLMLNMMDLAEKRGIAINTNKLKNMLDVEVCTAAASKGKGVFEAADLALKTAEKPFVSSPGVFSREIDQAVNKIKTLILPFLKSADERRLAYFYAVKLFEGDKSVRSRLKLPKEIYEESDRTVKAVEDEKKDSSDSLVIGSRYDYAENVAGRCVNAPKRKDAFTEKADRILTGKYTAFPCFAVIMAAVYYFSAGPVGVFFSNAVKSLITEVLADAVLSLMTGINCADWLTDLVTEGIMGGVGTVVGFLPQLALLFLMLALLEDIGYMSRAAFITDRFFRKFGLSGKAFIPMLIATGCGVPAIMSSRTVENPSQRRITIITSTFMPCGAKLPVIAMISSMFFEGKWWVSLFCYFLGALSVLLSGLILKKTKLFSSADQPFVMDMPSYHMPLLKNVVKTLWERCGSFLKRAGTTILLASAVISLLSSFGFIGGKITYVGNIEDSILKNIGEVLAAAFEPLGFGGWQPAVASIMGLLAKEELVGVFGVLAPDEITAIFESSLAAFSFLVFNLLCAPCIAAISAIKKEMNSSLWTVFALAYQTAFAYTVSFCIYNLGAFFLWGNISFMTVLAFAAMSAVLAYGLSPKGMSNKKAL